MQHEFLLIERLRDINFNKIFNNSFCHSVGVSPRRSRDGVNTLLSFILKEVIEKLQARINTFDHFPFF